MDFLSGYRTYICVGLAAGAYTLFLAGVITAAELDTVLVGLGIPALGFLRAAIAKPPPPAPPVPLDRLGYPGRSTR